MLLGALLVLASVAGCASGQELGVDLQTDLVPGLEFDLVEVSLDGAPPTRIAADALTSYDRPRRIFDRDGVVPGRRTIAVTLRLGAASVVSRRVQIPFARSHLVTVVISRDCRRSPCASTGASECLAEMLCAPPECTSLGVPGCPDAVCATDADCSASAACAQGRCVAGACLELPRAGGCGAGEACVPDRGCVAVEARDAGPSPVDGVVELPDASSPPDGYTAPLDCTSYQDCARCPEGWCVRGACSATNPATVVHDFETSAALHLWSLGDWTVDSTSRHTGTQSLRSDSRPDVAFTSAEYLHFDLAHPASLTLWARTGFWGSGDQFRVRVVSGVYDPAGSLFGTTFGEWVGYEVPLPAGAGYVLLEHEGAASSEARSVWIDDVVIGPPVSPSTDFEAPSLPMGYVSGYPWWTVEACPGGRAGQCARSGIVASDQRSSLMRMVRLPTDDTLAFWVRTSTHARDTLWIYVDGERSGRAWSGEIGWTLATIPLTAGAHTIEWVYEKDATLTAGSDAVWIDDVSFGPFTPDGSPLCAP